MKSKLSKNEMLILIGFVLFFLVILIVWGIQNRNKLVSKWHNIQKEIRKLRYDVRLYRDKEAKQRRKAVLFLVLLKVISLIVFFGCVQLVHCQFNFNPLSSIAVTFSVLVFLYYTVCYLASNTIYSFSDFLQILNNNLIKLFMKRIKVNLLEIPVKEKEIEVKQIEALRIKEEIRAYKRVNRLL